MQDSTVLSHTPLLNVRTHGRNQDKPVHYCVASCINIWDEERATSSLVGSGSPGQDTDNFLVENESKSTMAELMHKLCSLFFWEEKPLPFPALGRLFYSSRGITTSVCVQKTYEVSSSGDVSFMHGFLPLMLATVCTALTFYLSAAGIYYHLGARAASG